MCLMKEIIGGQSFAKQGVREYRGLPVCQTEMLSLGSLPEIRACFSFKERKA